VPWNREEPEQLIVGQLADGGEVGDGPEGGVAESDDALPLVLR
jgi:hypothetical protein